MHRSTLGIVHQLVVGLTVAGLFVVAIEAVQSAGATWNLHHVDDDGNFSIHLRDGADRLKVKSRGKIVYENERRIASLEAGARLRIEERLDGIDRLLVVTPQSDGAPSYDYRVDGDAKTFDAAAETWFSGVVLRLYRRAGVDADGRARRLATQGGLPALLDEVAMIPGDEVAARYLAVAVELAEPGDLAAVLDRAAESLDSDYYLYRTLGQATAADLRHADVRTAFRHGADKMSSDYHLRRLLGDVLDDAAEPAPEVTEMLFQTAQHGLRSGHEIAELILQLAEARRRAGSPDASLPTALDPVLRSISSDHHLQRAVDALMSPLPSSDEDRARLLDGVSRISSNYHAAEILISFAHRLAETEDGTRTLPEPGFRILERIRSSHDAARAADALAQVLEAAQVPRLLDAVHVQGDYHKRVVLESVLERHGRTVADTPAFRRILESMNDYEREQVVELLSTAKAGEPVAPPHTGQDDETGTGPEATEATEATETTPSVADAI